METMKNCRACTSDNLLMFLDMGSHPPANQFRNADQLNEKELAFPLLAHVCLDCALIEVPDFIPPDYFRHYIYVPSASATMHQHFAGLAGALKSRFIETPEHRIVDIGSNDGLFLKACNDRGISTLGIEPAANLTETARSKGIEVENVYFSAEAAKTIRNRYGAARVIVTTNTFNHIDDLHGFMKGVSTLLDDDGVFVVEVPQALDLVENNEFDTIYHEHLSEFSVRSLQRLYEFFEMEIFDIERLEIHGGSMRVFAQKKVAGRPISSHLDDWFQREVDGKLFSAETYHALRARVEGNREELMGILHDLKRQGKRLAGYGAPAKGNSLLNYYGIGPELVDFLADRNELKQGLYSPGANIPVVSPDRILEEQPDYLLILAWNFGDEIMQQQEEYRRRGGKFIIPIPQPTVIE